MRHLNKFNEIKATLISDDDMNTISDLIFEIVEKWKLKLSTSPIFGIFGGEHMSYALQKSNNDMYLTLKFILGGLSLRTERNKFIVDVNTVINRIRKFGYIVTVPNTTHNEFVMYFTISNF